MTITPGTRLGRYEILAPIGAGGMGEVYRARDTRLGREVAVKILPAEFAHKEQLKLRFEREARAIATLSHPNILSIYDFGMQDETAYAVMELLRGETLRERLESGTIPQRQVVDWAMQIARGLSAAHENGVIHRDLKPENIFITSEGHIKILDFGLAKHQEIVLPDEETLREIQTNPGTIMGTVGYMSPEQVRGHEVDQRSDIFSFGAILYEMLTGKRVFKRGTAGDTMAAILHEEPEEMSASGRQVSPALDHIVRHCLEKKREQRFHSAHDILFALSEVSSLERSGAELPQPWRNRTILVGAIAALVAALVGVAFLTHRSYGPAVARKRIAVLPFENLGPAEQDFFAQGIADQIRGKLTSLGGLEVIARGSSTPYKKSSKTPQQIARELGVNYLLTATVGWQKESGTADRVRVNPELVEIPESGMPTSRWEQPFDASLTDVFQVQSDIATNVAQALDIVLGAGEKKNLGSQPTRSLEAYEFFLRGEDTSKGMAVVDPPSLHRAAAFYERAVALDPRFAEAWAHLGRARSTLYFNSIPMPAMAQSAREATDRAVSLAPDSPETFLALADFERNVRKDNAAAVDLATRGVNLYPGNSSLIALTGVTELLVGRWGAALEHLKRAEHLDPRSVSIQYRLGRTLLWLRRYSEAREVLDRALALAPANLGLIELRAMTYLGEGDLPRARSVSQSVPKDIAPAQVIAFFGMYWDLMWILDEAQQKLLLRLSASAFDDNRGQWALVLAQTHALAGNNVATRAYAKIAKDAFEEQLRATPADAQLHAAYGLALAYLGHKDEATREGKQALVLLPPKQDAVQSAYDSHQLARIYTILHEQEKAIDQLEALLEIPYYVSRACLKIDPNFDSLRGNPRFQRLVASK